MSEGLKPCPWCGAAAVGPADDTYGSFVVTCSGPCPLGPCAFGASAVHAAELWNKRGHHARTPAEEELIRASIEWQRSRVGETASDWNAQRWMTAINALDDAIEVVLFENPARGEGGK